jgi:hypothetical protein
MRDEGFDSWGLGLGWRAFENEDFVFKLNAEYRAWTNSNLIFVEGMGGIKRGNSTVYMSVSGAFYNNSGNAYGFGLADEAGAQEYVLYEENNKNPVFVRGTIGLFTVLSPDFSLDLSVVGANLSWHNVINAGALVAFQPTKSFAIMAYGQYTLYDDAGGRDDLSLWSNLQQNGIVGNGLTDFRDVSLVRLEKPNQFVVGAQMKIYF